jgi:hypothetical protein
MRILAFAFVGCLTAQDSRPGAEVLFAEFGTRLEQPRAAVRADGTVVLVFVRDRKEICCAVRAAGATEFAPPAVARKVQDLAVGRRRGPRVALTDKAIVVSYIESRFDGKRTQGSRDLLVIRSTDLGKTWSQPRRVNSVEHSAAEGLHALAATRDGKVGALWLDPRDEPKGMKLCFAESSDDGASFPSDRIVYRSPTGSICECCHPSLAYDAGGLPVAMWRNSVAGDRDLFVASSAPGKPFSEVGPAGQGHWKLAACPMDGGDMALLRGTPVTVWRREDAVFAAKKVGEEQRLGRGEQPVVAIGPKGAFAAWQEGQQIVELGLEGEGRKRALGAGAWPVAISTGEVFAERGDGERIRLVRLGG